MDIPTVAVIPAKYNYIQASDINKKVPTTAAKLGLCCLAHSLNAHRPSRTFGV